MRPPTASTSKTQGHPERQSKGAKRTQLSAPGELRVRITFVNIVYMTESVYDLMFSNGCVKQ